MSKSLTLLAAIAICGLSSCDKIRSLTDQLGKKPSGTSATPRTPPVSEIPKGVLELLPSRPSRIVIVDYYADWCGPCRQLSPILEKIADENSSSVVVCKVNVDKFGNLASEDGVSSIPDVRIFLDGKRVDSFVGARPESDVRKRIEKYSHNLPPEPPQESAPAARPRSNEPTSRPMPKDWLPPGVKRR